MYTACNSCPAYLILPRYELGEIMTLREIGISVVIGLAFWFFGRYALSWVPFGYVGSILISIVGALVFVWIAKKIRSGKEFTSTQISFSAIFGCALLLSAARIIAVSDSETIILDCANHSAYKDPASVNRNGVVVWKIKGNLQKNFTVTFTGDRAPFLDTTTNTYKKIVNGLGQSPPETAKNPGFFTYQFTCADGTVADPMLFVPRP